MIWYWLKCGDALRLKS